MHVDGFVLSEKPSTLRCALAHNRARLHHICPLCSSSGLRTVPQHQAAYSTTPTVPNRPYSAHHPCNNTQLEKNQFNVIQSAWPSAAFPRHFTGIWATVENFSCATPKNRLPAIHLVPVILSLAANLDKLDLIPLTHKVLRHHTNPIST